MQCKVFSNKAFSEFIKIHPCKSKIIFLIFKDEFFAIAAVGLLMNA